MATNFRLPSIDDLISEGFNIPDDAEDVIIILRGTGDNAVVRQGFERVYISRDNRTRICFNRPIPTVA